MKIKLPHFDNATGPLWTCLLLGWGFFVAVGCNKQPTPQSPAGQMLQRTAAYLWSQQGEDGGWHSEKHGILRSGQTCTPFVLEALMQVPDSIFLIPENGKRRALDFIHSHTTPGGILGIHDPDLLEYPNYSSSYALIVLRKYGSEKDYMLSESIRKYLLSQQMDEERGISPDHSAYGGWGFGETHLPTGQTGHVDLSHTRRVLQALRTCGYIDTATVRKARTFLLRMQQHPEAPSAGQGIFAIYPNCFDGGFIYSPVQLEVNKGGLKIEGKDTCLQTYATATADGLLAGHCLGNPVNKEAEKWLNSHIIWERPEGIPTDQFQQWHAVMQYYHWTTRAQAYAKMRASPVAWRPKLLNLLAERQAEDGSFSNPNGAANKEDDPLLASSMAVRAIISMFQR